MKKTLAIGLLAASVIGGSFLALPAEAQSCHHHWRQHINASYNPYAFNGYRNAFNGYVNPYVSNPNYNSYNSYNYGNGRRNIWNRLRFGF